MKYFVNVVLMLLLSSGSLYSQALQSFLDSNTSLFTKIYKHLHQNPELSGQEKQTSAFVGRHLRSFGFEVHENFGDYGVVGLLKNGKGPTVLLRTDMDALPIAEQTELPYKSTIVIERSGKKIPVMHACGHDIHMTVFLGVAKYLALTKKEWSGTVLMVAQPAEEISQGAKAMLKAGLFKKFPRPDANLALHVSPTLKAGTIGYVPGNCFSC